MNDLLWVILLSLVPVSELRGALIYGVAKGLWMPLIVPLAIVFNIIGGILAYVFVRYIVGLFLHIGWFNRFWNHIVLRSQHKLHPAVEKYGVLGLILFVGIPLPGTGVYTAAIGAYAFGFSFKRFLVASTLGVLMAAVVVTVILLSGKAAVVGFT